MFWPLVSLFMFFVTMQVAGRLIAAFWSWLGKGKKVAAAAADERCDPEVASALAEIEYYRLLAKDKAGRCVRRRLSREELREVSRASRLIRDDYLDRLRLGWFQMVMLFFIGSVLGLVLEEVWMLVSAGLAQSRVGLIWGPFSPLYGVGAMLLTALCFALRRRHAGLAQVFLSCMLVGGLLEQATGWSMETFLGAYSWDYVRGGIPLAVTRWVAVPFLFFWGVIGLVWHLVIMPELLFRIGEGTTRRKAVFVSLLGVYLVLDVVMTLVCFDRRVERAEGIPAENAFDEWIDEHYSNEFMSRRFQNMVFEGGTQADSPLA